MRIKQRLDDFRVRELLAADFLQERGEYRVYRVTKRKLTSLEAAKELAHAAGVPPADVAMAGLKDRQGVTTQFMTIRRGREVSLRALDLTVETAGFSRDSLASQHSLGNAFEVTLRGLQQEELDVLRANVPLLRECGMVNYFDEQRFGNIRHNQGWIAQQLMRGEHEAALKRLLASLSDHDDGPARGFKTALLEAWGDWSTCRDLAGRFGQHHSVFEYLKQNDGDFAGAFFHVSSRLRLIHLYAFQSHIWNRAVADCVQSLVPQAERVVLSGIEGPLVYPSRPLPLAPDATFRLPGAGLEDVRDPKQRGWLEDALSRERMVAADFRVEGVSGFQLKGEERTLLLQPQHLRVRPPERDILNYGAFAVKVRFELQRGAYATLVVRRLLSTPGQAAGRERGADRGVRDPRTRDAEGEPRQFTQRPPHEQDSRGRGRPQQGREEGRESRDRGERDQREPRRPPVIDHRESGESLAPPRRDSYGRDYRDTRDRGRDGADRRPFNDAGRGGGAPRDRGFDQRGGSAQRGGFDNRGGSDQRGSHDQREGSGQREGNGERGGYGQRGGGGLHGGSGQRGGYAPLEGFGRGRVPGQGFGSREGSDQRGRSDQRGNFGARGGFDPRGGSGQRDGNRERPPYQQGGPRNERPGGAGGWRGPGNFNAQDQRGSRPPGQGFGGQDRGPGFGAQRPWSEDRGRNFSPRDQRGGPPGGGDRPLRRDGGFRPRDDDRDRSRPENSGGERELPRDDA